MLVFILLTSVPISLFGIGTTEASLSDLDNIKPTKPIEPETDSPTEQSDKEGTTTNDLPEAGTETQDKTSTETNQGNDAITSEKDPNLKVRPFINCDLDPSASCVGTEMSDTILGGKYPDQIIGHGGGDWINASGGNDIVYGDGSDDIIYGDKGNDILNGNDGSDRIFGGDGIDQISGGTGDDRIFDGNGNIAEGSDNYIDSIDCGSGNDEAWMSLGDHQKNCEKVNVDYPN
jgi:Ca2+-binding RTX toxin-like protein